jgi:hypothetical protein
VAALGIWQQWRLSRRVTGQQSRLTALDANVSQAKLHEPHRFEP